MAPQRRERTKPTDDWQQLALRVESAGQRSYELIRPVVLFGHSPAERAAATGTPERTLYRQVARFAQLGMASCVSPPKVEKHRTLPPVIRQAILTVTEEHPFDTPHRSPQPPLWAWGADEWLRVLRLPAYAPRRRPADDQRQAPLFTLEGTG